MFAAIVLPFALYGFCMIYVRAIHGYQLPTLFLSKREIYILTLIIILWGVVRNIPGLLAPQ
jgi:hypothetical protein